MKRNYKEALITLAIGLLLVVIATVVINVSQSFTAKTEADAVDRWIEQWEKCEGTPEMKVNVATKEFNFSCPPVKEKPLYDWVEIEMYVEDEWLKNWTMNCEEIRDGISVKVRDSFYKCIHKNE